MGTMLLEHLFKPSLHSDVDDAGSLGVVLKLYFNVKTHWLLRNGLTPSFNPRDRGPSLLQLFCSWFMGKNQP